MVDSKNETSITIALVMRTIESFDSLYTSKNLTSLENKETLPYRKKKLKTIYRPVAPKMF